VLDGEVTNPFEGGVGEDRARRVRRAVDDDERGVVGDDLAELVERGFEPEPVCGEIDPLDGRARHLRHRLVAHPRRIEEDDLVALLEQGHEHLE